MRVIDSQLPEEAGGDFLELLLGLRAVAGRITRAAELRGVSGEAPDEATLDFLVGLVHVAESCERWVETTAAAAVSPVPAPVDEPGRLLR